MVQLKLRSVAVLRWQLSTALIIGLLCAASYASEQARVLLDKLISAAPDVPVQIAHGLDRILYGSDAAFDSHPDPHDSWIAFRTRIPLTAAEFETIARNVAPYLH